MMAQVVTANRLADGAVVFRTAAGWSTRLAEAEVHADVAAPAALKAGEGDVARHVVVGAYLVEVACGAEGPVPVELRERIRARGPTIGIPGLVEG
jgi:hypothetical protein